MMISLVTATLGRVREVQELLDSLAAQTYKNFELVIVDQNSHTLLQEMVEKYAGTMNIKYIRSSVKGLSYNRNIGLRHCTGEVVGFPDDDCFYDADVLLGVSDCLAACKEVSFVASGVKDVKSDNIFISSDTVTINRRDVFRYCISYNVFVRNVPTVFFDETLGVGSFYGSGEETDYLWELLRKRDTGAFLKNVYIHHPQNDASENCARAYSYGLGFGALFKKEIVYRRHYSYLSLYVYHLLRTVGGLVLRKHKSFYYHTLRGRIKGFLSFRLKQ